MSEGQDEPKAVPMPSATEGRVNELWQHFCGMVFERGAAYPAHQIIEMRRAFYGGVASLLDQLLTAPEMGDDRPDEDGCDLLSAMRDECMAFWKEEPHRHAAGT